ncbi:MAG: RodZ domain-containing protein [Candidatus Zixiibacteriota bacterium]
MGEVHVKLGMLLKLERERRNLALADLSQELKISETNLQHIEDGNVAALPSELYFNLFGKSYAEALGIDFARTIEAIREDLGEPIEPTNGAMLPADERPRSERKTDGAEPPAETQGKPSVNIGSMVTIILLAIVAILIWIWFAPDKKVMLFEKNRANGLPGREKSASELADSFGRKSTEPANLNLKLIARDRSWATVLTDGDTALATTLKPWREYTVGARDKLVISLQAPLSVDAFVNNRRVDLSDPEKGTVEKVEVTLANLELYIKTPGADTLGADSLGADKPRQTLSETVRLAADSLVANPPLRPPKSETADARRDTVR